MTTRLNNMLAQSATLESVFVSYPEVLSARVDLVVHASLVAPAPLQDVHVATPTRTLTVGLDASQASAPKRPTLAHARRCNEGPL